MARSLAAEATIVEDASRRDCFVISPIGREGSEEHKLFSEVLEFIIKPAVKQSGLNLRVIRADDIDRSGSFIKDILDRLLNSHVVIADLTSQNPNVFYELGVRHALSPRTILIAQSVDEIPSDLREYRAIVYETSARGAVQFGKRLKRFLTEIESDPHRPDNPVLDRLGSVLEERTQSLEAELGKTRKQLESVLKGSPGPKSERGGKLQQQNLESRLGRLLSILGAERQYLRGEVLFDEEGEVRTVQLPADQGPFHLHFVLQDDGSISGYLYLAIDTWSADPQDLFPDIRVLMQACSKGQDIPITFIIPSEKNLEQRRRELSKLFREMRKRVPAGSRSLFSFDLWDAVRLEQLETTVGLRVSLEGKQNKEKPAAKTKKL